MEKVFLIAVVVGICSLGDFFIDAFTPDITEINTGGESLTVENGAGFYVPKALKIKTMDGQTVKWKPKLTADGVSVLLVPGDHAFTLDFKMSDGEYKWSAKDLKISDEFEPGKYYRFDHTLDKETKMISYSIKESEPEVYESGFDPVYSKLIIALIGLGVAGVLLVIFLVFGREPEKKG
jgi:hypothetical protein